METQKVGAREFRDNMATYLDAETPVTITRHGESVAFFIPIRRKRSEAEWAALQEASEAFQLSMTKAGITEDELIEDFRKLRRERHK